MMTRRVVDNILEGIGTLADLQIRSHAHVRVVRAPRHNDAVALHRDWFQTGEDITGAINRYKQDRAND